MSATVKYGKKRDRESSISSQLYSDKVGLVERVDGENSTRLLTYKLDDNSSKRLNAKLEAFGVFFRGKHSSSTENSNSKSLKQTTQSTFQQTFLELGQSKFDSTQCKECGMVYTPGLKEESQQHDSFCNSFSDASSHRWNWQVKEENIVWSSERLSSRRLANGCSVPKCSISGCIIRINGIPPPSSPLHAGFSKVQKLLSSSLGEISSPFSCSESDPNHPAPDSIITWIFLERGTEKHAVIAGVLTTEPISSGHSPSMIPFGSSNSDSKVMSIDSTSAPKENLVLGIAQVYTNPTFQRRGVASSLLDVARASAVYGYIVPKDKIAFSQLTQKGFHLAASYVGSSNVFIYR